MTTASWVVAIGGDTATRALLRFLLEREDFRIYDSFHAGPSAVLPPTDAIALVVLTTDQDVADVTATLTTLRHLGCRAPTVLLSRRLSRNLRRCAFDFGVHDVIQLPATPAHLQARLRATLRHETKRDDSPAGRTVCAGGWTLSTLTHQLTDGVGWSVRLTQRETALLQALMQMPGKPVRRPMLADQIWGDEFAGSDTALDMLVHRLRDKLARSGAAAERLRTVRGHGYSYDARSMQRKPTRHDPNCPPTVLINSDDPATIAAMGAALRDAGYRVLSGVDLVALILAREEKPSVILLDATVPGLSAATMQRRLREDVRTSNIPVIAIVKQGQLRKRALEIDADDYLSTPIDVDELLYRVEHLSRSLGDALLIPQRVKRG